MKTNNKYSFIFILERFNDEQLTEQINNLNDQLILYESNNKNRNYNETYLNQELIIKSEKIILSIIKKTLSEKINFLITNKNTMDNSYILFLIKLNKIKKIIKLTKNIENCIFQKIKKNKIKKFNQSTIVNFLLSFYDFNENEPSFSEIGKIINTINDKNVLEESYG